ncbi:MAG: ATP-binding cassette domain-containing protein [Chlamydiota bacterium]
MIKVDNLSMSYGGNPVFEDVSFSIQRGERIGLVGRNGSGKTTLFRILIGMETQDAGSVHIPKDYRIGYLNQHIQFTQMTVLDEAGLGLPEEEKENLYKVEKILFGLGFSDEDLQKSPSLLSGGYHLRLHLAKVLLSEPDCLLLDEPTNYLDIVSVRWLGRFLGQWKGELMLITHDREFMDSVSTHTMGIHRQKMRKIKGSSIAFFEQIVMEEEVHERTRVNVVKKKAQAELFIERFGAKASKASQAQSRKKTLEKIPVLEKLKDIYHLSFEFNEAPFAGKKILEAKEVSFSYDSKVPLIEKVSLSLEKGERIAIIGKNGRGKSTLVRLLSKDLDPIDGSIKLSDNAQVGYFGQTNIERLHKDQTIEEEISLANPKLSITQIKAICGLMMFSGDFAKKRISVLSGGERSRVLLGKIVAKPCNLLLLDEPTHHLDMESIEALIDALEAFQGTIVIVTHSELILQRLPLDKIVICHSGKQEVFEGGYEEFLEKIGWSEEASAKPRKKNENYQELKKRKAEIIVERSKVLKSLESEIQKCEAQIIELEAIQEKDQKECMDLSSKSQGSLIQGLLKTVADRQIVIRNLYEQLESFSNSLAQKKEQFSNSIDEIERLLKS